MASLFHRLLDKVRMQPSKQMAKYLQALLPSPLWLELRQHPIIQGHQHVADYWAPIIQQWTEGKLPHYQLARKKDLPTNKIIWQYWGQGTDAADLPEVVRLGFASVDHFAGDYQVIRLSDATIQDYLDLPSFVGEKMRSHKAFNRTFFSDLLRVALLATYGGVWLDATILLTTPLPKAYTEVPFFAFQRDAKEKDQLLWRSTYYEYYGFKRSYKVRLLNSILFAQQGSAVIEAMLDLLLYYWQEQDDIIHYFFFQILFHELVQTGPLHLENGPLVSDLRPHLIQKKIARPDWLRYSWDEVFQLTSIHKLSYFDERAMTILRQLLQEKLPELHLPERNAEARNPK